MKFRFDIQGLRGFAIISVLANHFAPDLRITSGGFIGVDIFFVVSGFLITTLVIQELEKETFSILRFWTRRILRILPSLILMLTISMILIGTMTTNYVRFEFFRNLAKASTFTSNLGYSQNQDYFSGQTKNPLLHLWSLAIEEQFYLVWPLLCLFFHNVNKKLTIYFSFLIAICSFLVNIVAVHYFESKSFAFYNTSARIWELLIGAIVAQIVNKSQVTEKSDIAKFEHLASLLGFAMIVASLLIITEESAFPGFFVLMPTLGTSLMILAGSRGFFNYWVFANPVLIWFGSISYALYLWHYPLIFLMRTISPYKTNFYLLFLTLLFAIFIAYVSTKYIESPLRQTVFRRQRTKQLMLSLAVLFAVAISFQKFVINKNDPGFVLEKYSDVGWGDTSDLPCMRFRKEITVKTFRRQGCFSNSDIANRSVMIVGDSHSASLRLGLGPYLETRGITLLGVSTGFCHWWEINPRSDDEICTDIYEDFFKSVSELKPEVLIIDAYWAKIARDNNLEKVLVEYIKFVQSLGAKKIIIVGQVPTFEIGLPQHLNSLYVSKGLSIPEVITRAQVINDPVGTQERMKNFKFPSNVFYRSIDDLLCDQDMCRVVIGPNLDTDLIIWDSSHLTKAGATFVSEKLFADIDQFLRN